MTKSFLDHPQLLQLQEALWRWPKSQAALMVGAGLSLNADPLPGTTTKFPTWRELVRFMYDELHPNLLSNSSENKQFRDLDFSRLNPLRIASEYEAAFGRRKLELLIKTRNPDADFQPSRLHKLLLELPWTDIFTTNYDTLLERTEVSGRAYQTIIKASELTTAFAPRIVKLHGSFPSQTPYIITEDDYRTYHQHFAPFINSVKQSLLENTFILLGFSGDDPNFLEWTGWIRDELGNNHAPVYLVGALDLRPAQRSLLAIRGVTPIDLAPLFVSQSPPQGVHAAAIEWFVSSLACAKPPQHRDWPNSPKKSKVQPLGGPSIVPQFSGPPELEFHFGSQFTQEDFNKLLIRWRFERLEYPGWVVMDESKRATLWDRTKRWISPLLSHAKSLIPADQLVVLGELNWRLEVSLIPLFTGWIEPFDAAVNATYSDIVNGTLSGESCLGSLVGNIKKTRLEAWFSLAFGLLREARESYEVERWYKLKTKIEPLLNLYPIQKDRYGYETSLWFMWNVDHPAARESLNAWQPSINSPLASIWKASLLAELDELDESQLLLNDALTDIRKALRNKGNNLELLSLEGWCMYHLMNAKDAHSSKNWFQTGEFWDRWQELKAWDCSPWPLISYFKQRLIRPSPTNHHKIEGEAFDPGVLYEQPKKENKSVEGYFPAFGCIRFYEQAGFPLRLHQVETVQNTLASACHWIQPFISFWSPALLIRAGQYKILEEGNFLSRTEVASMDVRLAKRLYEWGFKILEQQLGQSDYFIRTGSVREALMETLPEVLSRLTFRLDEDLLKLSLPTILQFIRHPGVRRNHRLHESASPWFRRLFEAAEGSLLLEWLPTLITLPLFEDGAPTMIPPGAACPDPMRDFPVERARVAVSKNPKSRVQIHDATSWLLLRASTETGEARFRALLRLTYVFHAHLMDSDQKKKLGTLLWIDRTPTGIPNLRNFAPFSFLNLPSPKGVNVARMLKKHILSLPPLIQGNKDRPVNVDSEGLFRKLRFIAEASQASEPIVRLPGEISGSVRWSSGETRELFEKAKIWWKAEEQNLQFTKDKVSFLNSSFYINTLNEFGNFFSRAILPNMKWAKQEDWDLLLQWIEKLREFDAFATKALPYTLLHRPQDTELISAIINKDLKSHNKLAVGASAAAIRHWIHLNRQIPDEIPLPSHQLQFALINRVAFRQKAGLEACIRELTYLIGRLPDFLDASNAALIDSSLDSWAAALGEPVEEDGPVEFPVGKHPQLQVLVARLAAVIQNWYFKYQSSTKAQGVETWKAKCLISPLPEVRRAFASVKEIIT